MIPSIYWISTSLITLFLLWSAYSYFFVPAAIEGIRELGFPDFFRIQLGILKLIAGLILIFPISYQPLKEWAYAGVGLFLLTALVAHLAHRDPWTINFLLLLLMAILICSYVSWSQLN